MARLAPFLFNKGARQRIILYLMSIGYSVPQLVNMKITDIEALSLPEELAVYQEEIMSDLENEALFIYPNSKMLNGSARKAIVEYLLSKGATVDELKATPMAKLGDFDVPTELRSERDLLAKTANNRIAFTFPSGKSFAHTDFYKIIRNTSTKVLGKKLTQTAFRDYITKGTLDD